MSMRISRGADIASGASPTPVLPRKGGGGEGRRVFPALLRGFLLLFCIVLPLAGCGINNIPSYSESAKAAWAQVLNQYQRRADLVPNLVQTVKGAANFETKTLQAVVDARSKVGQIAFEPVANLDAQLAVLGRDKQEHAVVPPLLADTPAAAERQPPVLDGVAGEVRQGHDDELDLLLLLKMLELGGDPAGSVRVNDVGEVDDAPGQRRHRRAGKRCAGEEDEREKREQWLRQAHPRSRYPALQGAGLN